MPALISDPHPLLPDPLAEAVRDAYKPTAFSRNSSAKTFVDEWSDSWAALSEAWEGLKSFVATVVEPAREALQQVTLRLTLARTDTNTTLRIAELLSDLLLSGDLLQLPVVNEALELRLNTTKIDRVLLDSGTDRTLTPVGAELVDGIFARPDDASSPAIAPQKPGMSSETPHTLLARRLRDTTGLPAASLGSALGVTREQFQRWLSGKPISTVRHGQLAYVNAIADDVQRRLGAEQAKVWWRTPIQQGLTPEEMLSRRLTDAVHQLVAQIPDRHPVVDGVLMALPSQLPYVLTDYAPPDDDDDDNGQPWSPYGKAQSDDQ